MMMTVLQQLEALVYIADTYAENRVEEREREAHARLVKHRNNGLITMKEYIVEALKLASYTLQK